MPGVLLDREMPRRNRVAPVIGPHHIVGVKGAGARPLVAFRAMSNAVTLCLTTVGSEEDAAHVARHLVETKAAACVSIVAPVRSFYVWKGELQDEPEWLLLIKTARPAEELRDALRSIHPYAVPEFLAFPASFADEAYAKWVGDGSGGVPPDDAVS